MKIKNTILIVMFLSLLLSCSHHLQVLKPGQSPVGEKAVLYGRFYMAKQYGPGIALHVQNMDTGKSDTIGFTKPNILGIGKAKPTVQVFAVDPGQYRITSYTGIVAGNTDPNVYHQNTMPFIHQKHNRPFTVKPGTNYYLGDFLGVSMGGGSFVIDRVEDHFDEVTRKVEEKYGGLKGLESERGF